MAKKVTLISIGIFIIFNILIYISFYSVFLSNIPKKYEQARFNLVTAHFISFYESFPIKYNLINYENPILIPIRKMKMYFQEKGISNLPKNETERAIWFGITEFLPLYKDLINSKSRRLFNKYEIKFVKSLYSKLYKNMKLSSNYNFKNENNHRLKERIVPLFYKYYEIYISNHIDYNNRINEKEKEILSNQMKEVFLLRIKFFKNKNLKNEINSFYKTSKMKLFLSIYDLYITSNILNKFKNSNLSISKKEKKEVEYIYTSSINLLKSNIKKDPKSDTSKFLQNIIRKAETLKNKNF